MTSIKVEEGEDIDVALQRFKNKLRKNGWYEEQEKHRYFIKPSMLKHMRKRTKKKKSEV